MALFPELYNCPRPHIRVPLGLVCPQRWEALAPTDVPEVRSCAACGREVHLCRTPEEFVARGQEGHCVAIPGELHPDQLCGFVVGTPAPEVAQRRQEARAVALAWWRAVSAGGAAFAKVELDSLQKWLARD